MSKGDNPRFRDENECTLEQYETNRELAFSKQPVKGKAVSIGKYGESKNKESILGKIEERK